MGHLTQRRLLELWESCLDVTAATRADALLRLAQPDAAPETLADLPLGERERQLLGLRRSLLGRRMSASAACPRCGEQHDVEFDVDALLDAFGDPAPATLTVRRDDFELTLRPLTGADLAAVAGLPDADVASRMLLERTVLSAWRGEEELPTSTLSAVERTLVADALAEADPLGDLRTPLECAGCGHAWSPALDAAAYLWLELHDWALRLLRDVHELARAYGWTEDEVLGLSPWRRAAYLSLAGR